MSNQLSEVVRQLAASVAAVKKATLDVVQKTKVSDREVAEYAADTVAILGEVEAAMETAAGRLRELDKAGAFEAKAPDRRAVPELRRRAPSEEETETEGPEGMETEREDDPPTERDGPLRDVLSDDAINAIIGLVDAERDHEEAMTELKVATGALETARPGGKREATLRVTQAQARAVETWTVREEAYALQKLLADRVRPA